MKKKVIVSALSLAIGAGLAGSITGTAAWYQYSTKTQAALVGVAGGVKGNLQMRIRDDNQALDAGWTTRITKEEMATFLGAKNIVPVTSGEMALHDNIPANFYCNPIYGYEAQTSWKKAVAANYISIPLEFRYIETSSTGSENLAKDIYLSDLFIAKDASDTTHEDISSAIRFHISAYSDPSAKTNRLISKNGGETVTHGYLDLNGDGEDDRKYDNKSDKYGFTDGEGQLISYGGTTSKQISYEAAVESTNSYPILADIPNNVIDDDRKLGTTLTANNQFLQMDITIWVEGWQLLPEGNSGKAIWDVEDFVNAKFDIGFEFETPHNDQSKTYNIDYISAKPRTYNVCGFAGVNNL